MTSDHATTARAAVQRFAKDERLDGVEFTIEQRITDNDRAVETYHVSIKDGSVEVVDGPASAPDVTIRQNVKTAEELRSGTVHAQRAFLTGQLIVDGDVHKLLAHGQLLAELLRPSEHA